MPSQPSHQPEQLPLTWDQVAAFRLRRHHLEQRASAKDVVQVANDICGAQAQLLSAAQISLWARTRDLRVVDIDEALRQRVLVKAACMRRTLFIAPAEHLAVFVRGTARRAEKGIRWALGKGVPERLLESAIEAVLQVLDQPLTRPEIANSVCRVLGVQTQEVHGGGWGSRKKVPAVPVGEITFPVWDLLHLAAARGVVCYGPQNVNEPTFVRADAWIPGWQDATREQAENNLLRRYLRAYGPATAADFALWTGMTLTEARQIWKREQEAFAPVDVDGWTAEVLREDLDVLAQAEIERPLVRLLPYYDSFLLGHKERNHLVAAEQRTKVYRAQGWITPTVLVDSRVRAVWEQARAGNSLLVKVTKLEPLTRRIVDRIDEEAQDLGRFLGYSDVKTEIG